MSMKPLGFVSKIKIVKYDSLFTKSYFKSVQKAIKELIVCYSSISLMPSKERHMQQNTDEYTLQ